jgi:predicted secreted protein
MNVVGGLALYFVIWWITLFAVLPFGIRSQEEAGEVVAGTEPGAPVLPGLLKKAVITSLIAAVIFAGVWYVWVTYDI